MTYRALLCGVAAAVLGACGAGSDEQTDAVSSGIDFADIAGLTARGQALYSGVGECADCHGADARGVDAPSLTHAPSAYDIVYQLNTNPEMGESAERMNASNEDLVALAVYIRDLIGRETTPEVVADLAASLQSARDWSYNADIDNFNPTERDLVIESVSSFDTVIDNWERRSRPGSIRSDYEIRVARTYEPGEPKFTPEPGKVYFYEATGAGQPPMFPNPGRTESPSTQVVVGDAATKEVIAHYTFEPNMRTSIHSTAVTPDGRYVYVAGPRPSIAGTEDRSVQGLGSPATIIKVDALTLQPVEQLIVGGRMHHAQIFQDRYMLIDTFARDLDGLDIYLMDPETLEVLGGLRDEDLGGQSYTAFTDDEFIYILMQPGGYGASADPAYRITSEYNRGRFSVLRPFWVAKVDPETWEVVREYPYPGFRASWIVIDSNSQYMYISASGSAYLNKVDLETGEIVWTTPTGVGPYGASLNADESEIWVADKGETTGMFGRTMTVIETATGRPLETVFSGYQVDHVLLSPNGREMWGTSNADGQIYVFDAQAHEQTHVIDMPNFGDAHGLVWVWYDADGEPHVVRDQGGFHSGIHPAMGNALDY